MALTKQDKAEIQELFHIAVKEGQNKDKDKYKQTEKRLYAYPILKNNIERYKLDIEDIKCECKKSSKDIIPYCTASGGEPPEIEEMRAIKIFRIEQKILRDEQELKEINAALKEIEKDEYYGIIEMHYFQRKSQENIVAEMKRDKVTVWRNRKRLIKIIAVALYGADAL